MNKLVGLAALSPERRREIASMGGKVAHLYRVAHQFTPEEAKVAGRRRSAVPINQRTKRWARLTRAAEQLAQCVDLAESFERGEPSANHERLRMQLRHCEAHLIRVAEQLHVETIQRAVRAQEAQAARLEQHAADVDEYLERGA